MFSFYMYHWGHLVAVLFNCITHLTLNVSQKLYIFKTLLMRRNAKHCFEQVLLQAFCTSLFPVIELDVFGPLYAALFEISTAYHLFHLI